MKRLLCLCSGGGGTAQWRFAYLVVGICCLLITVLGLTMRSRAYDEPGPGFALLTVVNPNPEDPVHNKFTACGVGAGGETVTGYIYKGDDSYTGEVVDENHTQIDWKLRFDASPNEGPGWTLHVETPGANETDDVEYELFHNPDIDPTDYCPDERPVTVAQKKIAPSLRTRDPRSLKNLVWDRAKFEATGTVAPSGKEVIGYIYDHTNKKTKIWWSKKGNSTPWSGKKWKIKFDKAEMPPEFKGKKIKLHVQTVGGLDRAEIDVELPSS